VLQLEALYRLLDRLREDAVQMAEHPADEKKTEYGFGYVGGMLYALRATREAIDEIIAEANAQDEDDT
jgi:hypothetical protein